MTMEEEQEMRERLERIWRIFVFDTEIEECETEELPLAV